LDIRSNNSYPANKLSNFSANRFVLDGVQCNSFEGFLQSLKFKNPDMQEHVCTLVGMAAKRKGAKKNWQKTQTLWWKGESYKRDSDEYQHLLDSAYNALFAQSTPAYRALMATGNANLTHSVGKRKKNDTVLTEKEFVSRLMNARHMFDIKSFMEI
jgi:predicted NAD-dependent protein-ADP-ribosyltransferase YbiA (DUF1768 family)